MRYSKALVKAAIEYLNAHVAGFQRPEYRPAEEENAVWLLNTGWRPDGSVGEVVDNEEG